MRTFDPGFVPPHCPHPDCIHHRRTVGWRWRRHGVYRRQASPRVIRRFFCLSCERTFSTQTFDTTYWLKKPQLQVPIHHGLVACSAFRQLGRSLDVAHSTVQRQTSRLGRHALLFHLAHAPKAPPKETLVLDGFVSFECSQYWPFEALLLVGQDSHFIYAMADAELRRSGRMTQAQKRRREVLESLHGRPDPQATRKAVEAVIRLAAPNACELHVLSDEHQAYPRAFRRLPHAIRHETFTSRRCRTARNPLFPVDLLDLLIRHGGANHKRQTIAFSKMRQGAIERLLVTITWRNFEKRLSENDRHSKTPAQELELLPERLTVQQLLHRRLFPSHFVIPAPWDAYYWRDVETRQRPNLRRHDPVYAR